MDYQPTAQEMADALEAWGDYQPTDAEVEQAYQTYLAMERIATQRDREEMLLNPEYAFTPSAKRRADA